LGRFHGDKILLHHLENDNVLHCPLKLIHFVGNATVHSHQTECVHGRHGLVAPFLRHLHEFVCHGDGILPARIVLSSPMSLATGDMAVAVAQSVDIVEAVDTDVDATEATETLA
jgi:hypothetical protein